MAMFEIHAVDEQIKAFPTVDTASGSIATFDTDMTENLVEVKCQIVAKQSGSGTPSPSNPRPITTYNQLNLAHIGNTDKMSWLQGVTSGIYGIVDLGSLTWTKDTTTLSVPVFRAPINDRAIGTLYGICDKYSASTDTRDYLVTHDMSMTRWNATGTNIAIRDDSLSSGTAADFTTAVTGVYLIYELATPTFPTTYTANDFNAMLADFGIDGSYHNIPFGQTVANGVLDVTTGKLRVTHVDVDLGSLSWTYQVANTRFIALVNDILNINVPRTTTLMTEQFQCIDDGRPATNVPNYSIYYGGNKYICIVDTDITDPNDLIALVNGKVCIYPLNTPIEIQLDSITLQALLNENNIWCDTGDTEVKYLLTVGKKIS